MLHLEGNLLAMGHLSQPHKLPHQANTDFGLDEADSLRTEIERAYAMASNQWKVFALQTNHNHKKSSTANSKHWLSLLFDVLGYGPLQPHPNSDTPFHHTARQLMGFPIYICPHTQGLEHPLPNTNATPYTLLQRYLNENSHEHLWGLLTNGYQLRLLRQSGKVGRPRFVEWDVKLLMEEGRYDQFAALYRMLHATRMPQTPASGPYSLIEQYHQSTIEEGLRVREKLSQSFQAALNTIGTGLVRHPGNHALRAVLESKALPPKKLYDYLLLYMYRLIYLIVIEERRLIFTPEAQHNQHIYTEHYALLRWRPRSEYHHLENPSHHDLWFALLSTFALFEDKAAGQPLGIQPLGSELFANDALGLLNDCMVDNRTLMQFFDHLFHFKDAKGQRQRINYALLDVEELGSVYEQLIEFIPNYQNGLFTLRPTPGNQRKTTASYYTPHALVACLLESALDPVIEAKLAEAGNDPEAQQQALLSITVCDPAMGSGHFLIAAARRLAERLVLTQGPQEGATTLQVRQATREVIRHCLFGVDLNLPAVELCRIALTIESHCPGMPLIFLEHKIKHGNSLLGLVKPDPIAQGIPDGAFTPMGKDDNRQLATALRKRNKAFKEKRQWTIDYGLAEEYSTFSEAYTEVNRMQDDNIMTRRLKKAKYQRSLEQPLRQKSLLTANQWVAAFLQQYQAAHQAPINTEQLFKLLEGETGPTLTQARQLTERLAQSNALFHWYLEFPTVFGPTGQGGFDCLLGNPPWEKIKLSQKEYFATVNQAIAQAENKANREALIKVLKEEDPEAYHGYSQALHRANAFGRFLRASGLYPLTSGGDINLYSVFAERFTQLVKPNGRVGVVLPTGIATDYNNRHYFASLVNSDQLVSLYDFSNRQQLFPGVTSLVKFCLLTLQMQPNTAKSNQLKAFNQSATTKQPDAAAAYGFFLQQPHEIKSQHRTYQLTSTDFQNINPNTLTAPVFRTEFDARLTARLYQNATILQQEQPHTNPWGIQNQRMFDMSNDSALFKTGNELKTLGYAPAGNHYTNHSAPLFYQRYLPLFEAKMFWHYNHRYSSYAGVQDRKSTQLPQCTTEALANPNHQTTSWYWVPEGEVLGKLAPTPKAVQTALRQNDEAALHWALGQWLMAAFEAEGDAAAAQQIQDISPTWPADTPKLQKNRASTIKQHPLNEADGQTIYTIWQSKNSMAQLYQWLKAKAPLFLMGFRDVTNATNERTFVISPLPFSATSGKAPLIWSAKSHVANSLLLANSSSLAFDYIARQKIGGVSMSIFTVKQLPFIDYNRYNTQALAFLIPKVIELSYTAWDMKGLANAVWAEAGDELRQLLLQQHHDSYAALAHPTNTTPPEWLEPHLRGGCPLPPFTWQPERRAILQAEIDAWYAKAYGLTEKELRYILDPTAVMGEHFPSETFRVLKEKDTKNYGLDKHGQYRTQRLVLEAWHQMAKQQQTV